MSVERMVGDCRNFQEFDEEDVAENPDLLFGDGLCPGYSYVISGDARCNPRCEKYEPVSGGVAGDKLREMIG